MYGMGLRASPHPCATLSLRMNSYRSVEKSELEAFLSEARVRPLEIDSLVNIPRTFGCRTFEKCKYSNIFELCKTKYEVTCM